MLLSSFKKEDETLMAELPQGFSDKKQQDLSRDKAVATIGNAISGRTLQAEMLTSSFCIGGRTMEMMW